MHSFLRSWFSSLVLGCLTVFLFAACEDEETDLGLALQDSGSQYAGIHDTIGAPDLLACTRYDDSLLTSGYATAMVGYYQDATYGRVTARGFFQLALTNNSGVDFNRNHYVVDSAFVALTLVGSYPAATGDRTLHLRITQTAEVVNPDSNYYAWSSVPLSTTVFLDSTLTVTATDTVIRLALGSSFRNQISDHAFPSNEVLQESIKGLCIECVAADSDPVLLTFDMSKSSSGLILYYQDQEGETQQEAFLLGYVSAQSNSNHFCQFSHAYSGQFLQLQQGTLDSIEGGTNLYLEPLGGLYVQLNMDGYVRAFHTTHPRAVIHYAELLLPLSVSADAEPPSRIVACYVSGVPIIDYLTSGSGYDGYYDADKKMYRIRITQHLQRLMMAGADYGTVLMLDGRRSEAKRTILNGTQATDPIRIAFVYSE